MYIFIKNYVDPFNDAMSTRMVLVILIFSFILSSLVPSTCPLILNSLTAEHCTPGKPSCRIELSENSIYEITHPIEISNVGTVTISGYPNTIITCPNLNASGYLDRENGSAIHFENVTSVILERIRVESCLPKIGKHWSMISLTNCSSSRITGSMINNFQQNAIIYQNVPSVQIIDSTFSNGVDGRAIFFRAVSTSSDIRFEAHNSKFYNIQAPRDIDNFLLLHRIGGGAGILFNFEGKMNSYVNISASNFTSCSALLSPALFAFVGHETSGVNNISIEKSRFIRNIQHDIVNSMGGAIGAIFISSISYITVSACLFQANKGFQGGALSVSHYARENKLFLEISDTDFLKNMAQQGGAIFLNGQFDPFNSFTLNLTSNRFENNLANQSGGAIFAIQYLISIRGGSFRYNNASYGGAIAALKSAIFFVVPPEHRSTIFTRNFANRQGGAIYIASSSSLISLARDNETKGRIDIVHNAAGMNGGGIYLDNIIVGYKRANPNGLLIEPYNISIENNKVLLAAKHPDMCFGDDIYISIPKYLDVTEHSCEYASGSVNFDVHFDTLNCSGHERLLVANQDIDNEVCLQILNYAKGVWNQNLSKTYVFVPGLTTRINVSAFDILGNKVYSTLSFSLESKRELDDHLDYDSDDDDYERNNKHFYQRIFPSGTKIDLDFAVPKLYQRSREPDTALVRACIRIVAQSNRLIQGRKKRCFDAIFTKCLPGYKLNKNGTCRLSYLSKDLTPTTKDKYLINHPGMLAVLQAEQTELISCPWFHCQCHRASAMAKCYFDPLKPSNQCQSGMTGKFCSECPDGKIPYPPFNTLSIFNDGNPCFSCHLPILMIFIYILITLLITVAVMVMKVDIFADYVRTITFYSSSLYIISLTIGFSKDSLIRFILYFPITVMNLLITSFFPFCLPQENSYNRQLFETAAPFIFVVYIVVFVILVKYTSLSTRFGRCIRDIIYPIWTIIILTYSHICNQAFIIFKCVLLGDKQLWFYDPNYECYKEKHVVQILLSLFILYILLTFPIFLYIFSYSRQDHNIRHFIEIYDKRYKFRYKNWEIIKLFLRFVVGALLLLPHNYCYVITLVFLIMMILTAALQPAENKLTNHFESLCFLVLALLTLPSLSYNTSLFWILNILALVPYILITFRFGYLLTLRVKTSKFVHRILNKKKLQTTI